MQLRRHAQLQEESSNLAKPVKHFLSLFFTSSTYIATFSPEFSSFWGKHVRFWSVVILWLIIAFNMEEIYTPCLQTVRGICAFIFLNMCADVLMAMGALLVPENVIIYAFSEAFMGVFYVIPIFYNSVRMLHFYFQSVKYESQKPEALRIQKKQMEELFRKNKLVEKFLFSN